MSGTSNTRTEVFNARVHSHLTPYLAALHAECITIDKMTGTFAIPLALDKLLPWWKDRIAEAAAGQRVIVLLLHGPEAATKEAKPLVGVVMLSMPHIETSPFRASIESLLVSNKCRRRGGATALLQAVEREAKLRGKTLLLAETESDTPVTALLQKHSYKEAGRLPGYSLRPDNGERREVTFLYRDLS